MSLKVLLKRLFRGIFLALAFPLGLLSGFGRFARIFSMGAHLCALAPGLPGDYLRTAYVDSTVAVQSQNNLRLTASVVLRLSELHGSTR